MNCANCFTERKVDLDRINDFKKLLVLKTIVDQGSFRQAARKLGVTPSAISQSVSSLEKNIGKGLVIREKNSVRITPEAEKLLEQSAPAFEALKQIWGRDDQQVKIARLDLGSYESLATDILPGFLKKIRGEHQGAKINLVISRSGGLIQKLRTGELCTILIVDLDDTENIKKELIFEDQLAVYAATDLLEESSIEDLYDDIGLGVISPGSNGHPRFMQKFLNSFYKRYKATVLSDSMELLASATQKGAMISVLPKQVAKKYPGLVDITEVFQEKVGEAGHHRIVLAYLDKCDHEEAIYLANILKELMS